MDSWEKVIEENRTYCSKKPKSYYSYESAELNFNPCQNYELRKPLGRGKYSEVYEAIDSASDIKVVVKLLKPVRYAKIKREIRILQNIVGGPNIIKLLDICMDKVSNTPSLIFEHFSPLNLKHIVKKMNLEDIKIVLYQLLESLAFCHSRGIMHRDVKPSNIIIDPESKKIKLIDWGLSEFYLKDKEYHTRVSSRPYKGPELLIGYKLYDFAMDIWSVGCMLAAFIFKKDYFFLGKDNDDQLVQIVKFFGCKNFFNYLNKYEVVLEKQKYSLFKKFKKETKFEDLMAEGNYTSCTPEALDLLKKMLLYDHEERIIAREALEHPFFDSVRGLFNN